MTMFTLPNFCRVCLKYDKNLIDLAHIENEPGETLMSKLQHCVSEVEWSIFKPLLCHPCIKRLNIAYSFKKQCGQSAGVLKNYIELVKESQKKAESHNTIKAENVIPTTGGAFMLLPNQKYVKIVVGAQNQGANTFQNVFLNLIPANTLNPVLTSNSESNNGIKSKDTNQNVFLNLNNAFQKLVPVPQMTDIKKPIDVPKPPNLNVNQILTEVKSEELSVEIDPTVFELGDENSNEEAIDDYDEVISQAKITLKDLKSNGEKIQNGKDDQKHYVPILPKNQQDFFSSGQHFLFSSPENTFNCESCQRPFTTKKFLKAHINQFHLGKLPFKCEYCYTEYTIRAEYDLCIESHKKEADATTKSITLRDFANNSASLTDLQLSEVEVRKHNQKNKKKYFIKGMKNARCDICNREFSTQSYMQLHKKLHLRDDIGYKYKVFGRSKYGDIDKIENPVKDEMTVDDPKIENLDVTPDIFTEEDDSNDESKDDPSTSTENNQIEEINKKMDIDDDNQSDLDTEEDDDDEDDGDEPNSSQEKHCDIEKMKEND